MPKQIGSVEKRINQTPAFPTNLSFFQTILGVASIKQSDVQKFCQLWNYLCSYKPYWLTKYCGIYTKHQISLPSLLRTSDLVSPIWLILDVALSVIFWYVVRQPGTYTLHWQVYFSLVFIYSLDLISADMKRIYSLTTLQAVKMAAVVKKKLNHLILFIKSRVIPLFSLNVIRGIHFWGYFCN